MSQSRHLLAEAVCMTRPPRQHLNNLEGPAS